MIVREGVLDNPKVEAIFGLHVFPFAYRSISFRPGGIMAASDTFAITVRGRQTHAALPWAGIDPIVVSAQIVLGLQTIISRQADLTAAPAVVSIGHHRGRRRGPISFRTKSGMAGTIRTFDPGDAKRNSSPDQENGGKYRRGGRSGGDRADYGRQSDHVQRPRSDRSE